MCSSNHHAPKPKKIPAPPAVPPINTLTQQQLAPMLQPLLGTEQQQQQPLTNAYGNPANPSAPNGTVGTFQSLRHDLMINPPAPKNFMGPLPLIPRFPS